ncbi:SURF1 family protein [Stakelama marina]|uniref:SURF1-like protein n=1 Tax=Stakelama marina TaxID=2826939 RepID=A0A8T4IDC4_9SPHN|nr:SURF1 family protein [Stakelama marina]MBR0550985.1 SURF1 family protein [Stakelama marina]
MKRGRTGFIFLLTLSAVAFAGFVSLGIWQIHRLAWKEALIARVDARVAAAPVQAPGPDLWPDITAKNSEYLHVRLRGRFEHDRNTLVKAVTDLGSGYWVLTPLDTSRGFTVLVNRGFVAGARPVTAPTGIQTITGLLRISEPGGGFLRSNRPTEDRWYSRDVAAIAKARDLTHVAPYFVDADKRQEARNSPIGGLTVIRFHNNHLGYAVTWFVMALGALVGAGLLIRERFRPQKA